MSKAPMRPTKAAAAPSPTPLSLEAERQRAEIDKILQDLHIVNARIAEVRNEAPSAPGSSSSSSSTSSSSTASRDAPGSGSPFVSSLRALAESNKSDQKMMHLQQLLDRVCEYDRIILSKTAPPETNAAGVPLRRKSMGADLYSLPSHLRIIDRLLDVYNQSKRVAVIRTVGGAGSDEAASTSPTEDTSKADKATIESLRSSLGKATIKLDEADKKRAAAETDNAKLQSTIANLQKEKAELQEKLQRKERDAATLSEKLSAFEADQARREQQASTMEHRMQESSQEVDHLQRRLEMEAAALQSVLQALLSKANSLRSTQSHSPPAEYSHLGEEFRHAFGSLDSAIAQHVQAIEHERTLLLSVKDMLENELSSQVMQKDLLQCDLSSLSSEHEALKAAYHSLSYESAAQQRELLLQTKHHQHDGHEVDTLQRRVRELEAQCQELSDLPTHLLTLEEQMRNLNMENVKLTSTVSANKEELVQYKKLVENYKNKLRELSATSNKENTFLDSFEEVMQEEMMTMKAAFEAKLRAAREEADNLSKKHLQEINNLQASRSPLSFLNKAVPTMAALNVSAATTSSTLGPYTSNSSR